MAIPLLGPRQTVARPGGLTSAIGIQRVRGENRQAEHRENGCGCFDHCCTSR
jgi:hypothetical protein